MSVFSSGGQSRLLPDGYSSWDRDKMKRQVPFSDADAAWVISLLCPQRTVPISPSRREYDRGRYERMSTGGRGEKKKSGCKQPQPALRALLVYVCKGRGERPRDRKETSWSVFEEKHSSYCLLCLSFPFSLCNPSLPASQCVFEWVKHCHSPIASLETLLQTDWRSTAKGSLAG